jgi:hypothetical protein
MVIITITTDWGIKDSYVANFKGFIYKNFQLNKVKVVDITHQINPFDLQETYYVIKNSFIFFPYKTIHFIGVDNNFFFYKKYIVLLYKKNYFICCDNGFLPLLYKDDIPEKIIEVIINFQNTNINFKNIFLSILNYIFYKKISFNISINIVHNLKNKIRIMHPIISLKNKIIQGNIIYIDSFGNIVTNITKDIFYKYIQNNTFKFIINNHSFSKIYHYYSELVVNRSREIDYHGEAFILFNIYDHIEICIYKSNLHTVGGAATLLGISKQDVIYIKF